MTKNNILKILTWIVNQIQIKCKEQYLQIVYINKYNITVIQYNNTIVNKNITVLQ